MLLRNRFREYEKITEQQITDGVLQVVRNNQDTAIVLNTEQLQRGTDKFGKKIKPKYSKRTVEYKKLVGQPYDRVTLYDQGDFYRGFFMETVSFPVFILSSDLKTGMLAEKYGFIFGLDRESQREFNQSYIKQDVQKFYRKILHV